MIECDDCAAATPLVDGWHIRPADEEGIEGIVRVPCPNAERSDGPSDGWYWNGREIVDPVVEGNECE